MAELDLDALEALRAKANPGPWSKSSGATADHKYEVALLNAAPDLIAAAKERDGLKAWAKNLRFELLHNYQHAHANHLVRPKPGGDIVEWAAQELAALRILFDKASVLDEIRKAKGS